MAEVKLSAGTDVHTEALSVAAFVEDARNAASLYASASDCAFVVPEIDPPSSLQVTATCC